MRAVAESIAEPTEDVTDQPGSATGPSDAAAASGSGVDIERLADAVYKLMLDEARLERARGMSIRPGR